MGRVKFPGAPAGSWVSPEGWLIVGDEGWTQHEWAIEDHPPRLANGAKHAIRYETEEERQEARRRSSREAMRRTRARRVAA